MKVLVTYHSDTGNTKKLAHAIAGALKGKVSLELIPISEGPSNTGYELYYVGFPVNAHSIPLPVEKFLKTIPEGAKVALFATHGSLRGGPLAKTAFEHGITLIRKAKYIGSFGSRGKVRQEIIDALMKQPEHQQWATEAQGAAGHPNEHDLSDAAAFAMEILNKAKR